MHFEVTIKFTISVFFILRHFFDIAILGIDYLFTTEN